MSGVLNALPIVVLCLRLDLSLKMEKESVFTILPTILDLIKGLVL